MLKIIYPKGTIYQLIDTTSSSWYLLLMTDIKNRSSSLEELLGKNPIHIPLNPFIDTGIRFGRDEIFAMILNISATTISNYILRKHFPSIDPILINSIIGPILEKFGLLSWYFKDIFKKDSSGRNFKTKIKQSFKESLPTLIEDILLHDPIYSGMMYLGQTKYSNTPVWLLSFSVFVVSVSIVTILEVLLEHIRYILFKRYCFSKGFKEEKYFESRFYISSDINLDNFLDDVSKRFNLNPTSEILYEDRYFCTKEKTFLRKNIYIRSRHRKRRGRDFNTFQIVFTRPQKLRSSYMHSSYNYFPSQKTKLYFELDFELENLILLPKKVRETVERFNDLKKPKYIRFQRAYAHDDELLISIDLCEVKDSSFRIVEVKVYNDLKRLEEAMKYILANYQVEQTTFGKHSLT